MELKIAESFLKNVGNIQAPYEPDCWKYKVR